MIIPHGDYPKDQGAFNVIKMLPELFENVDFVDFSKSLSSSKRDDFYNSEMFLYASQYQSNYGAKLVMLLSAVERTNGTWKPLEEVLRSKKFKNQLKKCKDGTEAKDMVGKEIEDYLDNFGSTRSVVSFYKNNLELDQKRRLINGISYAHSYRKQPVQGGTLFKPVREPDKEFDIEEDRIDYELGPRLRHVIYDIRSAFVHNASYIPFPDRQYIKNKIIFTFEKMEQGLPKEQWIITLPFEALHEITRKAFAEYWRKEYSKAKK